MARFHLFEQVYLHKTTRGVETLIRTLLARVAEVAAKGRPGRLGLDKDDPLIRFFGKDGETIENYLVLDDFVVWAAIARIALCGDKVAADLARRLRERDLYKAIDINREFPIAPGEENDDVAQRRQQKMQQLEKLVGKSALGKTVLLMERLSVASACRRSCICSMRMA